MSEIRLSVVMTNYNDSAFLQERIPSILSQLGPSDEFIFVDDASTDHSLQIITSFAEKDGRLRIIKNPQNLGVVKSANRGVEAAQGEYLVSLAADDRIVPGFIEKTLGALLAHPQCGICFSDCAIWYDGFSDKFPDQIYTTRVIKNVTTTQYFPADQMIAIFRSTPWIPGHTSIFKRSLFLKYGGYGGCNEALGPLSDWFVFHSIALETGAIYIPEGLAIWRQHQKSYAKELKKGKQRSSYQTHLFKTLSQPRFKRLRYLFKESRLINYYVRHNLGWIVLRPQYWDFLFVWITHALSNRRKRYFGYKNECRLS